MRTIKQTRQFKKDLKREAKGQYRQVLQAEFVTVLEMLAQDQALLLSLMRLGSHSELDLG